MSKEIELLIEDYKQTIERLQQECTEKTDMNIKLMKHVKKLEEENLAYKQTCEDLKNALDESRQECIDLAKVIEEYSQKQRLA